MLKLGCNRRHCPSSSSSRSGPQDNRLHLHPRPSALFAKPPREPFSTRAKIHRSLFEFARGEINPSTSLPVSHQDEPAKHFQRTLDSHHTPRETRLSSVRGARQLDPIDSKRKPSWGSVTVGMLRRRFGLLAGVLTLSLIALYHGSLRTISSFSQSGAVSLDPDELKLYIGNIDSLLVEHPKCWPGK